MSNIAKRFATMTLLYWEPIITGSGVRYELPVEVKGFYLSNTQIMAGSPGEVIHAAISGLSDNMVLFYLTEPKVDGYVSWSHTLDSLEEDGMTGVSPDDIPKTHLIKRVNEYIMPRTKRPTIKDKAFIVQVQ